MLVRTAELNAGARLKGDVCIVGAGAAGITLAHALAGSGLDVLLLEGGGFEASDASQKLYDGTMARHYERRARDYLSYSRLRFFGGTTNHWAGWVRPLDPIDLEARDWLPHSGWPFGLDALRPHYAEAARILDVPPGFFEREDAAWDGATPAPMDLGEGAPLRTRQFVFSKPTRFGEKYRAELVDSPKVRLVLDANLVQIRAPREGSGVSELELRSLDGKRFVAEARAYVLACGGVENARLLLASKADRPAGVGNDNDLVGRYFMDHSELFARGGHAVMLARAFGGDAMRARRYKFPGRDPLVRGANTMSVLWLSEQTMREEGLLHLHAHLMVPRDGGVPALTPELRGLGEGLAGKAVADAEVDLRRVVMRVECAPHPDNRVTLTEERDALGIPRTQLDWKLRPLDARTMERGARLIAEGLGAAGVGRARTDIVCRGKGAFEGTSMGMHHIGTTRMHADPRRGVTDGDGRVHGLGNLYVAGSSLFPTSGGCNPTFTIVALALRLARHLQTELG